MEFSEIIKEVSKRHCGRTYQVSHQLGQCCRDTFVSYSQIHTHTDACAPTATQFFFFKLEVRVHLVRFQKNPFFKKDFKRIF